MTRRRSGERRAIRGVYQFGGGMRRRPPPLEASLPAELVDPQLWPLCPRFDGGTQPCVWWSARQSEYLDAGGDWPGVKAGN